MNLYELIPAYRGIMDAIEQAEPEEMQTLVDTLESVNASLEVKTDGYCRMIAMLDRHVEAMAAEQERLAGRQEAVKNKSKYMKDRLFTALDMMDKSEVRTDLFTVKIKNNPVSVDIHDPVALPEEYQRKTIKIDPDKAKIKAALSEGKEVPGASLMQGRRLEIK